MKGVSLVTIVALAILICFVANVDAEEKRICYFTSWSIYRPGLGKYSPDKIDFSLCSHINYAFATVKEGRLATFDENDAKLMTQLNHLKREHNVKSLISVGGWNFAHSKLTRLLRTHQSRSVFIESTLSFVIGYGFDGVDLDWEYPIANEKSEFTVLIREMRKRFDEYSAKNGITSLLITAAVAAGKGNIDNGYEVAEISKLLDFINIMTYDLHGPWEPHTGFVAPIYPSHTEHGYQRQLNVHWVAEYWNKMGCPKEKLVIGIPTYGHGFILADIKNNKPGAKTIGPSRKGPYTRAPGFLSYYEICKFYAPKGKVVWDDEQKETYAIVGDTWIGYDTVESVKLKAQLIKDNGYGGWMVWSLAMDDFSGRFCGQGRYPLLKSINGIKEASGPTTTSIPTQSHSPGEIPNKKPSGVSYVCDHLEDGWYQRSDDCQRYYRCEDHKSTNLVCKQHLVFDPETQFCSKVKYVSKKSLKKCHLSLLKRTNINTTPVMDTTTTYFDDLTTTKDNYKGIKNKKTFCLSKSDGYYSVEHHCHLFVRCVGKRSYWFTCQKDLYFNKTHNYCDYKSNLTAKQLKFCN